MSNGQIETYEEAARVIHLHLNEFCDESSPFPAMIAQAAREAGLFARTVVTALDKHEPNQGCYYCLLCQLREELEKNLLLEKMKK